MSELWYLGSMNDGLAIIDVPPGPAPVDHVNPNRPAPSLIIPLRNNDRVTQEVAEQIVREHNASIGRICGMKQRDQREIKYAIKYAGVLTEMWVTGFSEPMDVDNGRMERSVKASNLIADAKVFSESDIGEALRLTKRCHPSAITVDL